MVHRILVIGSALVALSLGACRSKSPSSREDKGVPPAEAESDLFAEQEDGARSTAASKSAFSGGTIRVFGIKIPTGMTPAKGPEKVYRFEGALPVERTANLLRRQLAADKEEKEAGGVLFRFAKPKIFSGRAEGRGNARALAVRVFPTGEGSAVDIWLEREYADELPDLHGESSLKVPTLPKTRRVVVDQSMMKKERQDRAAAVRALQKIERGEPLTPEEAALGVLD